MEISSILGSQTVDIVSRRSPVVLSKSRKNPFGSSFSNLLSSLNAQKPMADIAVSTKGDRSFFAKNQAVQVGDTGVTVQVSDLSLSVSESETLVGRKKYMTPLFAEKGAVEIVGTEHDDVFTVTQDRKGNTILEVESQGKKASINLGSIASLSLSGLGGEDTVKVDVENYYGGIEVSGGDDDDTITIAADNTLTRGVIVSGGAGDDSVTVSGQAMTLLVNAGAGADIVDLKELTAESEMSREINGDAGGDMIYGSQGVDAINGGAGSDLIVGRDGDDVLDGGSGDDVVYGEEGNDSIRGGSGNDILHGGDGSDMIYGESGDDVLMGESGGDMLSGGSDTDELYGGSSNDEMVIYSSTGKVESTGGYNFLYGGSGVDTFAPTSTSPTNIVSYDGTGNRLVDYDAAEDDLV